MLLNLHKIIINSRNTYYLKLLQIKLTSFLLTPSCPNKLDPHATSFPSSVTAKLESQPQQMSTTIYADSDSINSNVTSLACSWDPNCPLLFHPQEYTLPSWSNTNVCPPPPTILLMFWRLNGSFVTSIGCALSSDLMPMPSWPYVLAPWKIFLP